MKDHNRAVIVGQRSYGKGSVQSIFALRTAPAGLKLTTAKFYSPKDRAYSEQGVDPDIKVHVAAKPAADATAPAGSDAPQAEEILGDPQHDTAARQSDGAGQATLERGSLKRCSLELHTSGWVVGSRVRPPAAHPDVLSTAIAGPPFTVFRRGGLHFASQGKHGITTGSTMPEITGRQQTRIDPAPAWTVHTDAPLKGMVLAREAGTILAWDERGQLYLLDLLGNHRSVSRAPARILAGTISDNGACIALLGEGSRLWFLGADLDMIADRPAPPTPRTWPSTRTGATSRSAPRLSMIQFYNRHGKQAGRLETRHAMAHLVFVPDRPFLLGAATYGMLVGIDLEPSPQSAS